MAKYCPPSSLIKSRCEPSSICNEVGSITTSVPAFLYVMSSAARGENSNLYEKPLHPPPRTLMRNTFSAASFCKSVEIRAAAESLIVISFISYIIVRMMKFASFACDPAISRGRLFQEEAAVERSPFQRDRDRILHSNAFRRSEYKTQVFVNHEGDHYRTRLTHSLEVSQIARSLCISLGLNVELGEAIALAHDLGHTPFGHAGEDALKEVYPAFDHNAHALRVLSKLEEKYAEFDGLNLTWETLEGIAKHNGPCLNPPLSAQELNEQFDLELSGHASLEAQVASLADDIAYCNHDVDDGIRAGLFTLQQVAEVEIIGKFYAEVTAKYPNLAIERLTHEVMRRVFSEMVLDVLATTKARIAEFNIQTVDDVRGLGQMVAEFSPKMLTQIKQLKAWLMKNMYRHARVNVMTEKARLVVIELFKFYHANPEKMPKTWQNKITAEGLDRCVADYIAGMTDRFALEEYNKLP